MSAVVGALMAAAMLLCAAHYAAVSWPSIAYRPDLARPLRLDRPDSFGHCMMVALLTASTGASLLIYQLRRYRNDDFKGHYRLWRLVMVVMFLASINAMVGMLDWAGAILDTLFGKRVALTGSDWIRLLVSLGGAVLAIRLIAEVRRCRSSLGLMIAACLLLAIPEAAKWNVLSVHSLSRWILVTSAPLFACTALLLSLGIYLRMLYREVRRIDDSDPALERFRQFTARWFQRTERDDDEQQEDQREAPKKAAGSDRDQVDRGWWPWRRRSPSKQSAAREADNEIEDEEADAYEDDAEESETVAPVDQQRTGTDKAGKPKAKRRWFGLRRAKPDPGTVESSPPGNAQELPKPTTSAASPAKKQSRFSLRLKPPAAAASAPAAANAAEEDTKSEKEAASTKKRSSGLGWFRRGKSGSAENPASPSGPNASTAKPSSQSANHATDDSELDSDDIDWNSLNKTERRRLRKQLKRQNRAA